MMTLKMVGMIFVFFYQRKKQDDGIKKLVRKSANLKMELSFETDGIALLFIKRCQTIHKFHINYTVKA